MDAGSTGTRLHLHRYIHNAAANRIPFKVEEEIFEEVKPGLSSFSHDPAGAAKSIRALLLVAKTAIPAYMWEKTPIILRATAGLRLLPGDIADEILNAVQIEVLSSGFFAMPDAVSIMSGSDEGVYSWFTLNLLLNTLYSDNVAHPHLPEPSRSVAAFDLGGGSTQVTFWPEDAHLFDNFKEFERNIDFFGNEIKLFTHSFLGNGLVAARLNMLLDLPQDEHLVHKTSLESPCMPQDFELHDWEYALRKWSVRGKQNYSFRSCYDIARQFIINSKIMKLPALRSKVIYLFSYYYDRGLNAGLVKENDGGAIKLVDYKRAAEKACLRSAKQLNGPHWIPWQCHDLTYIYSLLSDGYGFDDTQPLFVGSDSSQKQSVLKHLLF
ncbi:GDA1/CD39 family protein [Necator americanus]|uniref:GDA1/CD39 family protein n=1 Tax=Necator americanus TaxID=51031 RepID=W2SIN7_NECAM|nr:GDA1/CD39 family protein [Necator americanus]ETN69445.1 GDA1/CD39 family protein [Necator americanus]